MEADLTRFLEFYGMPGSGKSTVSHLVADALRRRGDTVIEPTYDTDHARFASIRKLRKLVKLFLYAAVHPKKLAALKRLAKENGNRGAEILSQTANIVQKLQVYDRAARCNYVIFDEGLTQSAVSLVKNGQKSASENERILYGLCGKRTVMKIYIRVSAETALERMEGREKHDSRIEKIPGVVNRRKALLNYEKQCETIADSITADNADAEECAGTVFRHL